LQQNLVVLGTQVVFESFLASVVVDSTKVLSNCQTLLELPNQCGGAKQMALNELLRSLSPAHGLKVWLNVPWFS
jgi:hypothetical protein